MTRTRILGGSFMLAVLLGIQADPAEAAGCRNRISELGGRTAIHRGKAITDLADLKDIFRDVAEVPNTADKEAAKKMEAANRRREKFRKAFEEILKAAKLNVDFSVLQSQILAIPDSTEIDEYPVGTELEWMAFRSANSHKIGVLRDVCWVHKKEPLKAWTFSLPGTGRRFIIPAKCLNLAELKVPVCEITAVPDCQLKNVRVDVTGKPAGTIRKANLTKVVDGVRSDVAEQQELGKWIVDAPATTTVQIISFEGVVTDTRGVASVKCTAEVKICPELPKPPPCTPPSCNLKVSAAWPENAAKGTIRISTEGSTGAPQEPRFEILEGTTAPVQTSPGVFEASKGRYKVTLEVKPSPEEEAKGCRPSTCSTTVDLAPPPKLQPCPTCDSAWFLRAFAAYGEGLGSEETGSLRTPNRQVGTFKLDFNQGLGGGFEVEKRLAWGAEDWKSGNWGWNLGLTHLSLETRWTFDTSNQWHRDQEFVPTLILTTGPRFHLKRGDWDLHFGPVAGFAQFEDATFADGSVIPGTFEAGFEDSFAVGADFGFDAFLGKCWGLSGGVQYLKLPTETVGIDLDVDPLILKFGVVYNLW